MCICLSCLAPLGHLYLATMLFFPFFPFFLRLINPWKFDKEPYVNMVAIPRSNQLDQEHDQDKEPPYQPLPSRPITPQYHVSTTYHNFHAFFSSFPSAFSLFISSLDHYVSWFPIG